ncbi:MAG: hypothetical protein IKI75_00775 [Lachnospiraceae bacterium]|nr:hypothetical protein [Lachnospiraceae bacterium]
MDSDQLQQKFFEEQQRVSRLEDQVRTNNLLMLQTPEIAYRDLNSRYTDMELALTKDEEKKEKLARYKERKKQIEDLWHQKTGEEAQRLIENRRVRTESETTTEYYTNMSLDQMEVLLKNSNRGGNSGVYNDVVTDLELYNGGGSGDAEAGLLLQRIKESCEKYISSRNPFTKKGKIRKAMVMRVLLKVNETLQNLRPAAVETQQTRQKEVTDVPVNAAPVTSATATLKTSAGKTAVSRKQLYEAAANSYAEFTKHRQNNTLTPDLINAALKLHFEIMSRGLQRQLMLTPKEMADLDSRMTEIVRAMKETQQVDPDQSDTITSRFFNALGWAEHKPVITDKDGIDEAVSQSPVQKKMYHTINTPDGSDDAMDQAKQLMGEGRQYYSSGLFGKGTYIASPMQTGEEAQEKAASHCWTYGTEAGSVQFTLTFNKDAKIADFRKLDELTKLFAKQFPNLIAYLKNNEEAGKRKFTFGSGEAGSAQSIVAAFGGYNVIKAMRGTDSQDYYVAFDRSAITISRDVMVRVEKQKSDFRAESIT